LAPENTGQVSIERQALVRMSFLTGVFSHGSALCTSNYCGPWPTWNFATNTSGRLWCVDRCAKKADQSDDKANTRVGTISKLMVYLNGRGIAFLSHDDFKGVVLKEK